MVNVVRCIFLRLGIYQKSRIKGNRVCVLYANKVMILKIIFKYADLNKAEDTRVCTACTAWSCSVGA